jgi:phosphatidylglycerophosphate synthase
MLDRFIAPLIKPAADQMARALVRMGFKADHITLAAFGIGLAAALCIAFENYRAGAILILLSRICDALDGAVARQTTPTDAGGFLDITLDFLFYASIPLAFAVAHPAANALAAAVLLAAFIGTGSSFLAFAALAAKRNIQSMHFAHKSLYFLGGLTEATETLVFFVAICLWPAYFAGLAYLFAGLCCVTIATRIFSGWRSLR